MLYLDNNATTRVADEVVAAMTPCYRERYGNVHAIHVLGRAACHSGVTEPTATMKAMVDVREIAPSAILPALN